MGRFAVVMRHSMPGIAMPGTAVATGSELAQR